MSTGCPKVQGGAVMWIAGRVQYLIAQFAAQDGWRTPYSWMVNPVRGPGRRPLPPHRQRLPGESIDRHSR